MYLQIKGTNGRVRYMDDVDTRKAGFLTPWLRMMT